MLQPVAREQARKESLDQIFGILRAVTSVAGVCIQGLPVSAAEGFQRLLPHRWISPLRFEEQ
ncbi:MAG: hypothetical protein ACI9R3_003453, partial [Verrucomicrobiales bacterium]